MHSLVNIRMFCRFIIPSDFMQQYKSTGEPCRADDFKSQIDSNGEMYRPVQCVHPVDETVSVSKQS